MKLQYLGTAAAEGFPGVFCDCAYCRDARTQKGKNIRTRSQAILNDELLLDLTPDTYLHVLRDGLPLYAIEHVLVTHAHTDHFYPEELHMRGPGYARGLCSEKLHIYGGACVQEAFERIVGAKMDPLTKEDFVFHTLQAFRPIRIADRYTVTPLPAKHALQTDAFFYAIEEGGKNLLYAHDTGYFFEEVFAYLLAQKTYFHCVSLDCTYVAKEGGDNDGHMGIPDIERLLRRLRNAGNADDKTIVYLNHFSHHNDPMHDHVERLAAPLGMHGAYDGLTVEF